VSRQPPPSSGRGDWHQFTNTNTMGPVQKNASEAAAVERVALAAREVQASSLALEEHFRESPAGTSTPLHMARLTAATHELQAARDALDALLNAKKTRW
jgi:hypothetical protein